MNGANSSFENNSTNRISSYIFGLVTNRDDFGWPGNVTVPLDKYCDGEYVVLDPTLKSPYHLSVTFDFVIKGIGIIIVACLGIVGNTLSAIVLSRPQMKSSVTCLLLALAFCDTLLISISALIFGLTAISDFTGTLKTYRHVYYPLMVPYLYPISITAQTCSVYITLAVTIERYIAVCHPLRARSVCTWRRARCGVVTVFAGGILYNISRWFEVCTCTKGFHLILNATIFENFMCPLRQNPTYINIYVNWTYFIIMYLVPFSGLVVLNWAIYRQVRKANRERQVLSKLQRREMGLATMLLCVVAVFLVCNILPLVNNILESFYNMEVDQLIQCSNFLVVFNSSVNFVIYCTCGERFRRLLCRLCHAFLSCRIGFRTESLRSSVYRKSNFLRSQQGGDFEEMSLGSVGPNHTCMTSGNGNATLLVDLSLDKPNRRLSHYRNRTSSGSVSLATTSTHRHGHPNPLRPHNQNGPFVNNNGKSYSRQASCPPNHPSNNTP